MQDLIDCVGVPTFYVTVAISEPCGGGNVRVMNCAERHGVLIPQVEIIIPAINLVTAARHVIETAQRVFKLEMCTDAVH
jgi:hypothetical protein